MISRNKGNDNVPFESPWEKEGRESSLIFQGTGKGLSQKQKSLKKRGTEAFDEGQQGEKSRTLERGRRGGVKERKEN